MSRVHVLDARGWADNQSVGQRYLGQGLDVVRSDVISALKHSSGLPGLEQGQRATRAGKRHGLDVTWHANGRKESEATYEMGTLQGVRTLWYENGQKKLERSFVNGRADGPTTEWYESGKLWRQATWKAGKPDGLYNEWYESGKIKTEAVYEMGEIMEMRVWDGKGESESSTKLDVTKD